MTKNDKALLGLLFLTAGLTAASSSAQPTLKYPKHFEGPMVDTYTGIAGPTQVQDPFRWMEDPDAAMTQDWVKEENQLTQSYLETLKSRESIKKRLFELSSYERVRAPIKVKGKYFYRKQAIGQNQWVLYVADDLTAAPKVLLDPNLLSTDGSTSLDVWEVSPDGKYLAYQLQDKGTDWRRIKILEIETRKDFSEELLWSKYGDQLVWSADSSGFYYSRFPKPASETEINLNHKIVYHSVGSAQSLDQLVFEVPNEPNTTLSPSGLSKDGQYLVISVSPDADTEGLYLHALAETKAPEANAQGSRILIQKKGVTYTYVGSVGSSLYLRTNDEAPMGKVVRMDSNQTTAGPQVIIPEGEQALDSVSLIASKIIIFRLKDAYSLGQVFDVDGKLLRNIELSEKYISASDSGSDDPYGETFISYSSYLSPGTIVSYNVNTGDQKIFSQSSLTFDPQLYETRQVFYPSKDGTLIPMMITAKRGLNLDGSNPTLLYGYGGFNISILPSFSTQILAWIERGGIYAVANIRGGGEYGRKWHEAGTKLKKQNVFDDFITGAEYLIKNRYTSPAKLAIKGGSNGGLLVGTCIMQRPDLFAAGLPAVGVMDMLRFNKFSSGRFWVADYGSPEPLPEQPQDWDPREFDNLLKISPYHMALRARTLKQSYPAILVTTSDHDDRVVPMHSYKFAAALQNAQAGAAPILIRIETNAGHGGGLPLSKRIQISADEISFIEAAMGLGVPGHP